MVAPIDMANPTRSVQPAPPASAAEWELARLRDKRRRLAGELALLDRQIATKLQEVRRINRLIASGKSW
jgi:hypothetical protein